MARGWGIAAALAAAALTATAARGAPAALGGQPGAPAVETAIRRVFPALVRIRVVVSVYQDGREIRQEASGSGVIVSADGYVVTNHHVAGRARRLSCTLSDRREVDATLVGTDPLADIAVLRLDPSFAPYPTAAWGDSGALRVGDPVLAMGSPLSLSQSVTEGIVSNIAMSFPQFFWPRTFRLDGEDVGSLVQWIGHDAQIFPGNSGGPLVNLAGEVVGINEISLGLAGAIPAGLARAVSEELSKHGEVRRSWLGLDVQPLLKGAGGPGALVSGVVPGSPAEKAGMRPGDILVGLAGAPVDVRHPEELPDYNRRVMQAPVGAPLELTYLRDGREGHVAAVTVERGAAQGDEFELRGLGVTVRELTLLSASERRREPRSGVLVTGLRQGGPAAEAKPALRPDDVVVSVAGRPVHSVRELASATSRASPDRTGLLLGFDRQGQDLLTVVRPGAHDEGDRSAEARKAWLPVAAQVLTPDLAEALGLRGRTGVRVTQVYPGSSAEAAGLRKGDVLLQLDGQAIPVSRPEELETFLAMVRAYPLGSRVKLSAVRDGTPLSLTAELVLAPPPARELFEYKDMKFEFAVRDLTAQDRLQSMFDREQPGALVTRVEAGGWAALAHLAVGDVVLSVDGTRVDGAGALRERMERLAAGHPKQVVFFVLRGVQTLFLELEPAWPVAPAGPHPEEGEHR